MTDSLVAPLKYHGGKSYLAKRIIALMPPHIHYVDPFFGGGQVLLAKDPEGFSEVVNDLNGRLMNFWRMIADSGTFDLFRRRIEATPFSEELWQNSAKPGPFVDCVDDAVWFFIQCRQSLAGRMKSFTAVTKTRTRRGMNNETSAWLTAVEGLPTVHERLKRVLILNRDALDVISGQDGKDTLHYLDPPYSASTRAAPDVYAHEMTTSQHADLLTMLLTVKGKFLLSGYRSTLYDDVASMGNWYRVDFDMANHAARGADKRRMVESVWANYPLTGGVQCR